MSGKDIKMEGRRDRFKDVIRLGMEKIITMMLVLVF